MLRRLYSMLIEMIIQGRLFGWKIENFKQQCEAVRYWSLTRDKVVHDTMEPKVEREISSLGYEIEPQVQDEYVH